MKAFFFLSFLFFSTFLFAQDYNQLHRKAIVVDTHNDVLSTAVMRGLNINNNLKGQTHSDIARLQQSGIDVQVFSIFCNERYGKGTAYAYANAEIDSLLSIIHRNKDKMALVTDAASLQKAVKQKKLACMMGVEGGHMIEDSMAFLKIFYERGVRYMTLTWNNSTSWATSAKDETANSYTNAQKGLSPFGKDVVRQMNKLGMLVDLSHVGEQTFWDAINTTTKPVIVSHSCVYKLCPVPRNLKDDQIKAVGKNGGVIHLNFYSGFLDSNYNRRKETFWNAHSAERDSLKNTQWTSYEIDEWLSKKYSAEAQVLRPPLSLLIDHIDYIVRMIGPDHVGLGSDFDGIESTPQGLDDVTAMPLVTKALLQRGYSKKDIKKILGENFIRILNANTKK